MPAKHFYIWLTVVLLTLLAGVLLNGSAPGTLLILGSVIVLAWVGVGIVHPWLGERGYYRVRYHAPDENCLRAGAIGRGLHALAQQGAAVALVWRREASELMLYVEIPVAMAEACEGMLSRLLPEATLEAVPSPIPVSAEGFYRRLRGSTHGDGTANPFDFTQLLSEDVLTGDFELRAHIARAGAAVVVEGTFAPQATPTSLRPLCKPLWRYALSKTLFCRYPLLEAWPKNDSGAVVAPAMSFPATVGEGTSRLDVKASLVLALPDDYCFPDQIPGSEEALLLGVSTEGNRPIRLSMRKWGQHFLAVGGGEHERQAIAKMMAQQVVDLDGGMVVFEAAGGSVRRTGIQMPTVARSRRAWIGMENPAGSLHLNLLSVPPIAGRTNSTAAEASALVCALEECVPLLGTYLGHIGVSAWGTSASSNLLLDWARLMLVRHHRLRILGLPSEVSDAPVPDLGTLYQLLSETEALPELVRQEAREWAVPDQALGKCLHHAGQDGVSAREVVQATLADIAERIGTTSTSHLRLVAACLRDQLRHAIHNPSLHRMWRGPGVSAAELLGRTPGVVLHVRLPLAGVCAADAASARVYGSYIVTCLAAAAKWRLRSGQTNPPVLVVLPDVQQWNLGEILDAHLDVLGHASIAVLRKSAQLPSGEEGAALLNTSGTWWIHSLVPTDAAVMRKRLLSMGVTADLPLTSMPAGVALLKFPYDQSSLVATAYTSGARAATTRSVSRSDKEDLISIA